MKIQINNTVIETEYFSNIVERKSKVIVRTLNKRTQVVYNFCGTYDMLDGFIELGCDELHVPTILWHETIHKILFEQHDLESTRMWDNIADELQYYLFNISVQDKPYIYSQPPIKAKEIDGGAWIAGKRKSKEKSISVGYKPDNHKRVPIRSHDKIMEIIQKTINTNKTIYTKGE